MLEYNLKYLTLDVVKDLVILLSSPITYLYNNFDKRNKIYEDWNLKNIELFNSKSEFIDVSQLNTSKTFKNKYDENYGFLKDWIKKNSTGSHGNKIFPLDLKNPWEKLCVELEMNFNIINKDINNLDNIATNRMKKLVKVVNECIEYENNNENFFQKKMLILLYCIYQYLNIFDDKSINLNLWNSCLCTIKTSNKYLIIGILTILSQITWIICLVYSLIISFEFNNNTIIFIIAIVSTVISILYSYNTSQSFINSQKLYKFILKINGNYNLQNRRIIIWNFTADFFSNLILPIIMPVINFFIVINSEDVFDAILNSMAIFFIIHIDEELFDITPYEQDNQSIKFVNYLILSIYNKLNPILKYYTTINNNNYKVLLNKVFEYKKINKM
jgi:hypothetical protein